MAQRLKVSFIRKLDDLRQKMSNLVGPMCLLAENPGAELVPSGMHEVPQGYLYAKQGSDPVHSAPQLLSVSVDQFTLEIPMVSFQAMQIVLISHDHIPISGSHLDGDFLRLETNL
jgi:hypothetical protein